MNARDARDKLDRSIKYVMQTRKVPHTLIALDTAQAISILVCLRDLLSIMVGVLDSPERVN
jgi:hypothetical protein